MIARRWPRHRFWFEAGFGALSAVLFVLTLFVPDWIEAVFRVDPDQHSGTLEWGIAAVLAVMSVASGALARREWRSAAPAVSRAR